MDMDVTPRVVRTAALEIALLEAGEAGGPPVLLLHGFPDDASGWADVMARLVASGCHVLAPYVRGCGPTRFLDSRTPRAGDLAALGQDVVELVDALDLDPLVVVGQDWGSAAAEIVAMERPERVRRIVKLNWYGVYSMAELAKAHAFHYPQLQTLWYVWMLNTPLGRMVLENDRAGFAAALWAAWSPSWHAPMREAALARVLPSFDNPDWARVALAAYGAGISAAAERDPAHDGLRERIAQPPPLQCRVRLLTGDDDGVERTPLTAAAMARHFPAGVETSRLPGVGHFPQREAPDAVAAAILED